MTAVNRLLKCLSALLFTASALSLSACDSGGSAGSGSLTQSTTPGGGGSSTVPVGESCTAGDAGKICLAMHFVTYEDPSGTPTATTDQAATIIHTMNQLWAQCDIGFQIENYEAVDPTQFGLTYGAASQNELDQIRTQFEQPTNELLGVTTGPWGTAVNAWTNLPGDGIYGSIMEASIVTYGNGIIYAHEFGHYLGLDHVSDVTDLMDPIIYTTSTLLNSSQCQTARATVPSYWAQMVRH